MRGQKNWQELSEGLSHINHVMVFTIKEHHTGRFFFHTHQCGMKLSFEGYGEWNLVKQSEKFTETDKNRHASHGIIWQSLVGSDHVPLPPDFLC